MKLELTLSEPMSMSDLDKLMESDEFNAPFIKYEKEVLEMCREGLEGQDLQDFETWWAGKSTHEFWETRTEKAYHRIMKAISYGLG